MKTTIFFLILTLLSTSSYSADFVLYNFYNCEEETGRVQGVYHRYNAYHRYQYHMSKFLNAPIAAAVEMVYAYPLTTILSDNTDYENVENSLKERMSGLGIEEWKLAKEFRTIDRNEFILSKVDMNCLGKGDMEKLYILATTPASHDLCADHSSSPCGVRFMAWYPDSYITVGNRNP